MSSSTSGPLLTPPGGVEAPVIAVEGLRKAYGSTLAVADVGFEVRRGEVFGILGPNGAGKTTTVECLTGLREPDGGRVSVLGLDPRHDGPALRERVGSQLQESELPGRLRVGEALDLFASFYAHPADGAALAERLGLGPSLRTPYRALSGGQKQRLSIALALIGNPEIAVLDELTTGLDPQARRDTWDLIESVRDSGVTIVLVTHFMDEAERLCDRLVMIDGGRVVARGTPQSLARSVGAQDLRLRVQGPAGGAPGGAADASDDAVVALLRAVPGVEAATATRGDVVVRGAADVVVHVVRALDRAGLTPVDLEVRRPSLEDAFVALTRAQPASDAATDARPAGSVPRLGEVA